jgi:RNA polymerase sigma-70 factor (ECF subfamily)
MQDLAKQTALVQTLFVQNMMALRGYVLALMPDFGRVDDIVQETFLTATAKATDFEEGTNYKAWIFAIARFKVLEAIREPACAALALDAEVIEALSAQEGQEDWAEQHLRALAGCVERLAPQAHKLIEMRYQQAERPPEIAHRMGWSVNSVNVALARARASLRGCVESALKKIPV